MIPKGKIIEDDWLSSLVSGLNNTSNPLPQNSLSNGRERGNVIAAKPIIGNRTSGPYDIYDLLDWLRIAIPIFNILRRSPLGMFNAFLMLQSEVIERAPGAAVANQEIHGSAVVNDPAYISGQFTF